MAESNGRIHHVFVTGLSTFPLSGKLAKTTYQFIEPSPNENEDNPDSNVVTYSCNGYYQLDPIPQFITENLGYTITDAILLATTEVQKEKIIEPSWNETPDPVTKSPLDYYKERLSFMLPGNPPINVITITVDEMSPQGALDEVMEKIRGLYNDTDSEDPDAWKLWFDTHGGFRDISAVMVSAARFFATDKHDPIRTDGIFSIYHSQKKDHIDRIVDQTGFYFSDSAQSLQKFLNFGQYLSMSFRPYEGRRPYGFVSYRHDKHFVTHIRNIFTWLKKADIPYWFDEGIKYGDNWREELVSRNNGASAFIMLLSKSYFDSAECWKEVIYAIHNAKKAAKQNYIHIFLLEENVFIPESLPKGDKFSEVADLAKSLSVNDNDVYKWLGNQDNTQWLQWYQYMDEHAGINKRHIYTDSRLDAVADDIKTALDES